LKSVLANFEYSIEKLGKDFDKLPTGFHFTKAMYGLLAMPSILAKKGVKKALYLDLDTLIIDNLEELYNVELGDYYCAGAHDIHSDDDKLIQRLELHQGFAANSGVLLMNIEKMNKIDWIKSSEELNKLGKIKWGDQDIVNILLDGKIKLLEQKWNVQSGHFQNRYVDQVSIVHFTESGNTKPWNYRCKHLYLSAYNTYVRRSGFFWDYIKLESVRRFKKYFKFDS